MASTDRSPSPDDTWLLRRSVARFRLGPRRPRTGAFESWMVRMRDKESIRFRKEKYAANTMRSEDGECNTLLMRAALDGQTNEVGTLLRKGADVNAQNREGRTALMFAIINLRAATVKTLLEFGADVNVQARCGCTPLMLAACSGDIGITRALLNRGADARKICWPGKTALVVAIEHGYNAIAELLKRAM